MSQHAAVTDADEQVDDTGQGVVVPAIAGEDDVGRANRFRGRLDGSEHRHHARQQLTHDLGPADAEPADPRRRAR